MVNSVHTQVLKTLAHVIYIKPTINIMKFNAAS